MTKKQTKRSVAPCTVWILPDQLILNHPAFDHDPSRMVVLLIESRRWATFGQHHKQKIVFVWSAMRHYAEELRQLGYTVDYHETVADEETAFRQHLAMYGPSKVLLMSSADHGVSDRFASLAAKHGVEHEQLPNTMFLSSRAAFRQWAAKRTQLRLEPFYRRMRRHTGLLMDGDEPEGGRWNYDRENRKRPRTGHVFPQPQRFRPDATTRHVIRFVQTEYSDHFGDLQDFAWPVTRVEAETARKDFLTRRLSGFGDYQDAIVTGEPSLYHSLLSPAINVGLLEPMDLCRRAEQRYRHGHAPLNAVEGFIRQIIGWREFVYHVYHLKMPGYRTMNALNARRPLPSAYWSGRTRMRCVADAVNSLRRHGTNHHIQRLMVTGNLALLADVDPQAVNEWYRLAYVDAWEWVVTPNVIGMALHADGGILASKPYAASANYLNRMSDCCSACEFNPRQTTEASACPFNALYWDFLSRHRPRLAKNPRMTLMLANLDKKSAARRKAIRRRAHRVLASLEKDADG